MKNIRKPFLRLIAGALVVSLGFMTASAAVLSNLSDTLSSLKVSTVANHSFVFTTPTGIAAGSTTLITFPSDFIIPAGLTFTDVDINIGGAYVGSSTLASVPSGATIGVARISTTTLLITNGSGAISAASTVYIRIGTNALHQSTGVNQIINPTTNGNKAIGLSGGTSTPMFDYGTTTVDIQTDDAVLVNAIVPQSISFSISSNSINFGNLSSGAAKYASSTNSSGDTADTVAHTLAVGTNAPSGYTITIAGGTLTSQQNAANDITANGPTPAASSAGTEQFGIYSTKSGGINGTIDSTYATPSSFGYDASATTTATFATGSSSTNTETYSLHYIANIAALTEAGNYSTSIVYVGTANY
jgi:hypothetical protein